jgi:hypothetical protein
MACFSFSSFLTKVRSKISDISSTLTHRPVAFSSETLLTFLVLMVSFLKVVFSDCTWLAVYIFLRPSWWTEGSHWVASTSKIGQYFVHLFYAVSKSKHLLHLPLLFYNSLLYFCERNIFWESNHVWKREKKQNWEKSCYFVSHFILFKRNS